MTAATAAIMAGTALAGSYMASRSADKQRQQAGNMAAEDRDFTKEGWEAALRANRVNQYNPWGSSEWVQDEKGNWTQNQNLNPAEQSRLDDFRQIAANRMNAGKGINLSHFSTPMDYESMGLGAIARAAGVQPGGTTGQRPWANSPYSSRAGDYLRHQSGPSQGYAQTMQQHYGPQQPGPGPQGPPPPPQGPPPGMGPPPGAMPRPPGLGPAGGPPSPNPSAPPPMTQTPIVPGAGGADQYRPGQVAGPPTPPPAAAAPPPAQLEQSQKDALIAMLRGEMDQRAEAERMRLLQEEHNRSGGA
jgi:hypothetical protein